MTPAEEFCKLNGIEWKAYWWCHQCKQEIAGHNVSYEEKCCICNTPVMLMDTTDFTDVKSILEVCMKWKDYREFMMSISMALHARYYIRLDFVIEKDKLLHEAIKWRKEHPV